jgi:hypothetical protein
MSHHVDPRIVEKWGPVARSLFSNENTIERMCEYCELDSLSQQYIFEEQPNHIVPSNFNNNIPFDFNNNIPFDFNNNLLPISLKIASKITHLDSIIQNDNLYFINNPIQQHIFSIKWTKENIEDLSMRGIEFISNVESALIESISKYMNNLLESNSILTIHKFAKEIKLRDEGMKITFNIISDYKITPSEPDPEVIF